MALLDRDGVYGAPRFHLAAQKAGYGNLMLTPEVQAQMFSPFYTTKAPGEGTGVSGPRGA